MPPGSTASGFETLPEDTPDIAGNPDTGISAVMTFVSGDSCAWMGADENASPDLVEKLRALGYLGNDAGGGAARAPLDPAVIGRLLAATCSPSQVVLFQKRLAAALGVDPAQPRADLDKDRDTIVREFLNQLSRRQNEPPHDMFFRYFGDHPFVSTRIDCKSTFGMDVDTASYTLARAYLTKGMLPPKAAIRTEEFVNAFKHGLTPPASDPRGDDHGAREGAGHDLAGKESTGRDVFAIHTEIAPSPFGDDGQLLLQVGLKARVISKAARKPVALTFIIDVSGSMAQDGRLELVKQSLHLLVDQLDERDSIGIVSFETTGHRVLAPTNAAHRALIYAALDQLRPEGSTNADEGLRFGYDMALEHLRPNAENRVILCSDGVANTGVTDPKTLSARIAECKSSHLYLNCVGVGMGNHNDALMEQLADEGDGFCAYLDRIEEAKKLFVDRLTGTLLTVARNAKIQVEFDPASVRRFRQIGYENRALAHRDFRNDKVDAGEVGAGQEVVALYEIEPKEKAAGPLATVRIRYEDPDAGPATAGAPTIREQARAVFTADVAPTLQKATPRFRLSACVAEFAEILRQSVHARDGSFGAVERLAEPLVDELRGDPDVPEFVALVQQAARLPDLLPPRNEMVRAVDELKKVRCWQEELRDSPNTNGAKDAADDALMRQLEEQNRRLEQALRDALDRALRHS
jgi:Ca-activated chloride channel family protein